MIRIDEDTMNGFVVNVDRENMETWVVENDETDEFLEARTMQKLLNLIMELCEYYPSKHDKIRCRVILEGE
jgi:hypothetical protein